MNSFLLAAHGPHLSADFREAIALSRSLKLSGLEWPARSASPDLTQLSASGQREVRHLVQSNGLSFVSLRVDLGQKGLSPKTDIDYRIDHLDAAAKAAVGLGVTTLCVELGRLPAAPRVVKATQEVTEAMAGLLIIPKKDNDQPAQPITPVPVDEKLLAHWQHALGAVAELADRFGVQMAFSSSLSSFAALHQLIPSLKCPWFSIDFDTAAAARDEWDLDEIFSQLGPLIRSVRARDTLLGEGGRSRTVPIGQGAVDWNDVTSHLAQTDYHGPITIDASELQETRAAIAQGIGRLTLLQ